MASELISSEAVEPALIADPATIRWDEETDVIVVGFGGAGVVAALQARESGADVLAIDRFGGGGATAYSGGINYAGATSHQVASGIHDTPEEMFKYLTAEGSPVSPETLRKFCEDSNANLEWLEANGVPYGGNAYLKKTSFPPNGYWLYYSGNEALPAFEKIARPAPRGHRPAVNGFGGHVHFDKLKESAFAKGVRLLSHAPVRRLVVNKDGRVLGVEVNAIPEALRARHDALYKIVSPWKVLNHAKAETAIAKCRALEATVNAPRLIRARAGVILSAGGFIYNLEMLRRFRAELADNYEGLLRLGSMGCDGSGIVLGQSAGGASGLMEKAYLGRPLTPPEAFIEGIVVNAGGQRFISEDSYIAAFGDRVAEQPDKGRAYLIIGHKGFWKGVWQSLFPGKGLFLLWGAPALFNIVGGGTRRATTLAKLAAKCGIDPGGLERAVAGYNATVAKRAPDPLGKVPNKMKPVDQGPYYAVNMSLNNKFGPAFAFTLGGLAVDEETGEVKRADGSVIPGLYAAGRTAIGVCSYGYMSGMSIADTVFSGRRAARHAAGRTNAPDIA